MPYYDGPDGKVFGFLDDEPSHNGLAQAIFRLGGTLEVAGMPFADISVGARSFS